MGYKRAFLDEYRPNDTAYLSGKERAHLREVGTPLSGKQPAGTYAKQILNRLLIDLSWNTSRLEGNTYSLLDTKRLIGFNRHTILNLHALLANNLLTDSDATGRLATADAITDPFEQAFFMMVQIPYLQPFDDVNKRVSRLAANIPLIKANLTPLSFTEVPVKTYTEAILGVYELNQIDLLKDVFIWAYERSASRYAAVRQSLGDPDPFRLKHRTALLEIVQAIMLERLDRKAAFARIAVWAGKNVEADEQGQFREVVENELMGLHEGNFVRYLIKPSQFRVWQEAWNKPG